jgi:hypothetical protein
MIKFNKKILAVMIASALVSTSAFSAAVDLDAAVPVAIKYASQIVVSPTTGVVLAGGAGADQTATTTFGASFGADAVAYVRVDLSNGVFDTAAPTFAVNDSGAGAATVTLSQGGIGASYAIFAVAPGAGNSLVSAEAATIATDPGAGGIKVLNQNDVNITYRLFETLTAAVNPSSSNTLKTASAKYITFASAYSTTVTATNAIADVGASPSYTTFTSASPDAALATLVIANGTAALADGSAATLANTLAATNAITLTGDFSAAQNDDGTYTVAALNKVYLDNDAACDGTPIKAASAVTANSATISAIAVADLTGTTYVCYEAEGTPMIQVSSYTGTLDYVPASASYTATDVALTLGNVTRNGMTMVAPLAQIPSGWLSRLVLTNSGSTDRTYSVRAVSETGTTVTLSGAAASGTIAGNSTNVVDLTSTMATVGNTRGTLVVTVNGPAAQIDGMYQIVNPTSGSISNHVLSYK